MRFLIYISLILTVLLLWLGSDKYLRSSELPVFLKPDLIADNHTTHINVKIHSMYKPDSLGLEILKKDYSAIWAHLNHLYNTNDVNAGKEYYTEEWFKQICKQDNSIFEKELTREDISHDLHIINWSSDNLVCTAVDSNVVFRYRSNDSKIEFERKYNLAVVLLYQGDHWRIDAFKQLNASKK